MIHISLMLSGIEDAKGLQGQISLNRTSQVVDEERALQDPLLQATLQKGYERDTYCSRSQ